MQTGTPHVPPEIVAAISAALSVMLERPFTITAIRPEAPAAAPASTWAKAGLLEQQMLRRNFVARTR